MKTHDVSKITLAQIQSTFSQEKAFDQIDERIIHIPATPTYMPEGMSVDEFNLALQNVEKVFLEGVSVTLEGDRIFVLIWL